MTLAQYPQSIIDLSHRNDATSVGNYSKLATQTHHIQRQNNMAKHTWTKSIIKNVYVNVNL